MYERFYEKEQYKANFLACSANKGMKTCFLITEWPELHSLFDHFKNLFRKPGIREKYESLFPSLQTGYPFCVTLSAVVVAASMCTEK